MADNTSQWRGDMEALYADHLDELCDKIKESMVALRAHLDHGEFIVAMHAITKEVMTHGSTKPDNQSG